MIKKRGQISPNKSLKVGSFFTGIDRKCYPRSLYQYLGPLGDGYVVRVIALAGMKFDNWKLNWKEINFQRGAYRLATPDEVVKYHISGYYEGCQKYGLRKDFKPRPLNGGSDGNWF